MSARPPPANGAPSCSGDSGWRPCQKSSAAPARFTTSTKSSTAPDIADFVKYVVAIDVKQHAASKTALTDMRNCHLRAIGLLEKNFKRLADPRGEGESGNSGNVMSMF